MMNVPTTTNVCVINYPFLCTSINASFLVSLILCLHVYALFLSWLLGSHNWSGRGWGRVVRLLSFQLQNHDVLHLLLTNCLLYMPFLFTTQIVIRKSEERRKLRSTVCVEGLMTLGHRRSLLDHGYGRHRWSAGLA